MITDRSVPSFLGDWACFALWFDEEGKKVFMVGEEFNELCVGRVE